VRATGHECESFIEPRNPDLSLWVEDAYKIDLQDTGVFTDGRQIGAEPIPALYREDQANIPTDRKVALALDLERRAISVDPRATKIDAAQIGVTHAGRTHDHPRVQFIAASLRAHRESLALQVLDTNGALAGIIE
jgi:hypothetical protein